MKSIIIAAALIIGATAVMTTHLNLLGTVVMSLLMLFLFFGCVNFINVIKEGRDKTKLFSLIEDMVKDDVRKEEKSLLKRDRAVKDTKTIKKIAKK